MKNSRHEAIRQLLREQVIVTQATVSRDIREMHLVKITGEDGLYRYAEPELGWTDLSDRLIRLLRDCVVSAEAAGQMIVVKTMSGSANTAAEALDSLEMPEIAGSIAGDNTIFLVARDHTAAQSAVERILNLIK